MKSIFYSNNMKSIFYSNNEKKENRYVNENRLREINQENQQDIVDTEIAQELGLESKATNIGLLAARVASKAANIKIPKKNDILLTAISNGQLTQLFNKIKAIPDSQLSKAQILIRDDLKDPNYKMMMNELISEASPNGPESIKLAVIEALGGSANEAIVIDMINKTVDKTVDKTVKLNETNFTNRFSKRKVLDEAIKNNKLTQLFDELKEIPDDFLNSTQKKIKNKLNNSDFKDIINDLISEAIDMGNTKNISKILLNELINSKKEEKYLDEMLNMTSAATSVMSDAPEKIDLRAYNLGRTKKDTNEELEEFTDLLIKYKNAIRGEKRSINQKLINIISRQPNKLIADRMRFLKTE